jgi:hypothetical protein
MQKKSEPLQPPGSRKKNTCRPCYPANPTTLQYIMLHIYTQAGSCAMTRATMPRRRAEGMARGRTIIPLSLCVTACLVWYP